MEKHQVQELNHFLWYLNCYDVQSHLIISKPKLFFIFYINSWIYQQGKNETSNVNIEQLAI